MKKWVIIILAILSLTICGCSERMQNTRVVLTTGFSGDEVFRIESMSCILPEALVYLVNMQNRYEKVYGKEIWEIKSSQGSMEDRVKDMVLAQLSRQKTMNLLAEKYQISLDEEEKQKVLEASEEYFSSLDDATKKLIKVEKKDIAHLYSEYALAEKVYQYIIKDINPEISDDEARTITVQYIFFQTSIKDGTGKKIEYSEEEKAEVLRTAKEVQKKISSKEADFEKMFMEYSDDEEDTLSFGKGEMEKSFENAAFNLATGEISDVVETSRGYYIIKCINTFNREETDANKLKIVEQRREEVFGVEYEDFVRNLTRNINEELWTSISLPKSEEICAGDFFEIYESHFHL